MADAFFSFDPSGFLNADTGSSWRADNIFASVVASDRTTYQTAAQQAALSAGVNPDIFNALITTESHWDPYALSPKGAIGLTQLMPGTAGDLRVNAYDPIDNLKGGATYLAKMLGLSGGDYRVALAKYNAGPNATGNALAAGYSYADTVLARATGAASSAAPIGGTPAAGAAGAPAAGSDAAAIGSSAIGSSTANLLSDPGGWLSGIGSTLGPTLWLILAAGGLIVIGIVMLKPKSTVVIDHGR